jgi:hypothetical protein
MPTVNQLVIKDVKNIFKKPGIKRFLKNQYIDDQRSGVLKVRVVTRVPSD